MTTASDLIQNAYEIAGILGEAETMSSSQATTGLTRLNAMLSSWQNDRLFVYQIEEKTGTLVANTNSYTVGSGGAFNTDRPLKIVDPCFVRENNIDYPVKVIEKSAYASIVAKSTVTSNYPEYLYYDSDYPLGTIYLYPTPSAANVLHYSQWSIVQQFATKTTDMALPPGYQEAIEYSLAKRLAALHGAQFLPESEQIRREAVANIKKLNSRPIVSRIDPFTRGRSYNIKADA